MTLGLTRYAGLWLLLLWILDSNLLPYCHWLSCTGVVGTPVQLMLTLLAVAAYSLVDKQAVDRFHPVAFAFIYPWFSMALLSTYLAAVRQRGALGQEWRANRRSIV